MWVLAECIARFLNIIMMFNNATDVLATHAGCVKIMELLELNPELEAGHFARALHAFFSGDGDVGLASNHKVEHYPSFCCSCTVECTSSTLRPKMHITY